MNRQVLIDQTETRTRRLVLEDGEPVEYAVENNGERRLSGNVFLARVVNVISGMQAAFVDIGLNKNAFLSFDDVPPALSEAGCVDLKAAAKPLKPGQEIIVQVLKEPGGSKGPRVSMTPSFPGKWTVLLPTVAALGVSRHIQGDERRAALLEAARRACPEGMGLIVRTAAESAACIDDELRGEAERLSGAWRTLVERGRTQKAPALLFDNGSLLETARRDLNAPVTESAFPEAVEAKLQKALRRKVWLSSGAYIVIDTCEALTAVDVNSGKFTGKKDLADTLRRLNSEAAGEIARQIRLRDLGGIIVIDFVDMKSDEDRQSVLDAFCDALKPDRAKCHVHGFSQAGLLELTRRPVCRPIAGETVFCGPLGSGSETLSAEND